MEDVSARTGLPLDQLDALEAGAVVRIPDRVAILKTLRRYADFLGLPGERFVVVVVDHWPVSSSVASSTTSYRPSPVAVAPAGTVAHAPVDTGMVPMATQVAPAGAAPPVAGRSAKPATHAVPVTVAPAANGVHTTTAQVLAVPNTGVTPAVPSPARSRAARRTPRAPHAPLALRVLVVVAALAVVAGVAGLVIDRYAPHWLSSLGITQSPHSNTARKAGGTTR